MKTSFAFRYPRACVCVKTTQGTHNPWPSLRRCFGHLGLLVVQEDGRLGVAVAGIRAVKGGRGRRGRHGGTRSQTELKCRSRLTYTLPMLTNGSQTALYVRQGVNVILKLGCGLRCPPEAMNHDLNITLRTRIFRRVY